MWLTLKTYDFREYDALLDINQNIKYLVLNIYTSNMNPHNTDEEHLFCRWITFTFHTLFTTCQ